MDDHLYKEFQINFNLNSSCNPNRARRCDQGRAESDATHPILRLDWHPIEFMYHLSCKLQFQNNSFSEICAHYSLYPDRQTFHKCLYCNGNDYYYLHSAKVLPKVYHFCSQRKS